MLEYRPGNSLLHRLNPLTKIVVAGAVIVCGFLLPDFRGPLVLLIAVLALAAVAGLLKRILLMAAAVLITLFIGVFVLQGLFHEGDGTALLSVGPVTLWLDGFQRALLIFFRIAIIVCAMLLFILSTHPKDLVIALNNRGVSPKLTYVLVASLQFTPQMQRRARAITEAQQARGLNVKGSWRRRIQALITIMVPLLVGALIGAETRALALEARGFSRRGPRTYLREVPDTTTDKVLRWAALVALAGVIIWRVITWLN